MSHEKLPLKKPTHILVNYYSVIDFSLLVGRYPATIYDAIKRGAIQIELVGKRKMKMIDADKYYKSFNYPKGKKNVRSWKQKWDTRNKS